MSAAPRYQNFGGDLPAGSLGMIVDDATFQDQKLESFEEGFQAGWEEAVKAQSNDKTRISTDFANNLQDASFSYHEARTAITKTLRPLFSKIVETMLPEISRASLGPKIVEQLIDMSRSQSDQVIEIAIASENTEAIHSLLDEQIPTPFVVIPDASLGPGQVFLRIGSEEREIDMDQIITDTRETMDALFHNGEQEKLNG